jgi:FkbM family methyltransferase
MRLPILAGALRGTWWLPLSGGKVLQVLGGGYEPEQTKHFEEQLHAGDTLLDVGAHVGYYTLISAKFVGKSGRVFSFEPNPRNHSFLKQHVAVNRLDNVVVEQSAVSDANGLAHFEFGRGSGTGHLAADGSIEVRTLRLDDYCRDHEIKPDAIKIDVEGAELSVLRGGESTIVAYHPVIFLSTHGEQIHRDCLAWLQQRGYDIRPILGDDVNATSEVLCTHADS